MFALLSMFSSNTRLWKTRMGPPNRSDGCECSCTRSPARLALCRVAPDESRDALSSHPFKDLTHLIPFRKNEAPDIFSRSVDHAPMNGRANSRSRWQRLGNV